MKSIPISVPSVGKEEYEALEETLMSGWITQGPKVKQFEQEFAAFHHVDHALAVTSCTTGLQLILAGLGIGSGDEVIVPAFTWVATANVVVHAGATPVFVDIDLNTYNMDPKQIQSKITAKTKAIIAVHLFGLCADMAAIQAVAGEIPIIEDAACAVGATSPDGYAGGIGTAASFSFHPRKTITTGEGGMVTTQNSELAKKMDILRNHGASISEEQRHHGPKPYILPEFATCGFNFRMTDIQATIGVEQMKKLPALLKDRQERAAFYTEQLAEIDWIIPPHIPQGYQHGWQAYVCQIKTEKGASFRNQLMDFLQSEGISTRPGTHAVHMLAYYQDQFDINSDDFLQAKLADQLSIALPLHGQMSDDDYDRVLDRLKAFELCVA